LLLHFLVRMHEVRLVPHKTIETPKYWIWNKNKHDIATTEQYKDEKLWFHFSQKFIFLPSNGTLKPPLLPVSKKIYFFAFRSFLRAPRIDRPHPIPSNHALILFQVIKLISTNCLQHHSNKIKKNILWIINHNRTCLKSQTHSDSISSC
jgi:hypothetical protein